MACSREDHSRLKTTISAQLESQNTQKINFAQNISFYYEKNAYMVKSISCNCWHVMFADWLNMQVLVMTCKFECETYVTERYTFSKVVVKDISIEW